MKKINEYFLGEEDEVTLSDKLWFYGQFAVGALTLAFVVYIRATMPL